MIETYKLKNALSMCMHFFSITLNKYKMIAEFGYDWYILNWHLIKEYETPGYVNT